MLGLGMLKAGGAPESVVVLHLCAFGFGTVEVRSSSASAGEGVVCKRSCGVVAGFSKTGTLIYSPWLSMVYDSRRENDLPPF